MRNTKQTGDISCTIIAARLLQAGYSVLMPIGDNQRYDLVIEQNGIFQRVQCKTGRRVGKTKGSIEFPTCSTYSHKRGTFIRKDYNGDADFFGVYDSKSDKVFILSIGECGKTATRLWVSGKRNPDSKAANDFELKYGEVPER